MRANRLDHALSSGLALPPGGRTVLIGAPPDYDLSGFDGHDVTVAISFRPDSDTWERRGVSVSAAPEGPFDTAMVFVPRARALAEARMALACRLAPGGLVVVDGQKEDGVEPLLRALKRRVSLEGTVSKAHGKIAWFTAADALDDWAHAATQMPDGHWTAPGVFSADGLDPASAALIAALPARLGPQVADLGAGWGALADAILSRQGVEALHLVEAEKAALDCARRNVDDPRVTFHWADATRWQPLAPLNTVVMNPPFHTGRRGDPSLGQAFIHAAARILAPSGQLWLVANRHLPYETTLAGAFREVSEVVGDSRFKILHAARPSRPRR